MFFLITNKKKIFYFLEEKQYIYIYTHTTKFFNRKTLKISYSCMENFKIKILKHNEKIVNNLNLKIQKKLQFQERKMPLR